VWEFLKEYRWEPEDVQPSPLRDEPPPAGDERWDALLAALEIQRADALVWAPAAFRKHAVYLSARDLEAA
jgi:hypothetical protein